MVGPTDDVVPHVKVNYCFDMFEISQIQGVNSPIDLSSQTGTATYLSPECDLKLQQSFTMCHSS